MPEVSIEDVKTLLETYDRSRHNLGEAMDAREWVGDKPVMTDWQHARAYQFGQARDTLYMEAPSLARLALAQAEEITQLRARAEAAEGTLGWYADPTNWERGLDREGGLQDSWAQQDEGELARAALAGAEGED